MDESKAKGVGWREPQAWREQREANETNNLAYLEEVLGSSYDVHQAMLASIGHLGLTPTYIANLLSGPDVLVNARRQIEMSSDQIKEILEEGKRILQATQYRGLLGLAPVPTPSRVVREYRPRVEKKSWFPPDQRAAILREWDRMVRAGYTEKQIRTELTDLAEKRPELKLPLTSVWPNVKTIYSWGN